jgi:hypothetical protein
MIIGYRGFDVHLDLTNFLEDTLKDSSLNQTSHPELMAAYDFDRALSAFS